MLYHVLYGIIEDCKDDVSVHGPYYGGLGQNHKEAEVIARRLTNQKTKHITIPWIIQTDKTVPELLRKARDTWFAKFRLRLKQSAQTLSRDYRFTNCPFTDVNANKLIKNYENYL